MHAHVHEHMRAHPDKGHLLRSEVGNEFVITIGDDCVSNSSCEEVLGVYFDN